MENNEKDRYDCDTDWNQNMFLIQNRILFKLFSYNKSDGYRGEPYCQEDKCEQDGKYFFD